jgi:hypothetical protein
VLHCRGDIRLEVLDWGAELKEVHRLQNETTAQNTSVLTF